jgi:hypothetical protein
MDIPIKTECLFSIHRVPGSTAHIIVYHDGTADVLSSREARDLYEEVMEKSEGGIDSPDKIQGAISVVEEDDDEEGDDFFDSPHEPSNHKGAKTSFDVID